METEAAIREGSLQVTALLLVAAGVLIALGTAGVGASLGLVAALLGLAGLLYLTRPNTGGIGHVGGLDVDYFLDSLWLAVFVSAIPVLFQSSATPAEVQALGGLLGLAGMANYFLRPLYLLAYDLVTSLTGQRSKRLNGR